MHRNKTSGLHIVETFLSIQGEGVLIGTPAYFIRFAGCNLNCSWCDTTYASRPEKTLSIQASVAEIIKDVSKNVLDRMKPKLIVLTGGEPLIQNEDALIELCTELRILNQTILIETNGTIFLPKLMEQVDFWSVSPKIYRILNLPKESNDIITKYVLALHKERPNVYFKFVVKDKEDIDAVKMTFAKYTNTELEKIPIIFQINTLNINSVEGYLEENRCLVNRILLDDYWNRINVKIIPQFHQLLWWKKQGV